MSPAPLQQAEPEGRTARSVRYLSRETSWLDFDARVLEIAANRSLPVLERARFLAIFSANLDDYFQVRVAALKGSVASGFSIRSDDGSYPNRSLGEIRARVAELTTRATLLLEKEVLPDLEEAGIELAAYDALTGSDREYLDEFFEVQVFPILTPLAVDPAHPFPYVSNLSLNLAVTVEGPEGNARIARVKVPPLLDRFVALPGGARFVAIEEVMAAHLSALFPGMTILAHHPFRVTRNTDFELDEEEDVLAAVEQVLRQRRHSEMVVRLEVDAGTPEDVVEILSQELDVEPDDVYAVEGLLDLRGLWSLLRIDRPDLKLVPWVPSTQPRLASTEGSGPDVFGAIREADVLVHHPYDSFETSVERFVGQAARDPNVVAIKQTLYRTSNDESPILRSLMRAAEDGKQVVVLVELKARFDEEANVTWAELLEDAGVHVVYGVVGLKTHAKISLVVRREGDGLRRYCHIGTGNYNPETATQYEDLGMLTARAEIGADLSDLFNYLTGYSRQHGYRCLLVAPGRLRRQLLDLIDREARPDGRIDIKVNNLVDHEIIDALYAASQAGCRVDLLVRSICCLRPGVPGLSERVSVRSIVGRFLEHSRIFRFGSDDRLADYYIGSADLMPRNLDRRVEALTPVVDPVLRDRLAEILRIGWEDDRLAWELSPVGTWTRIWGNADVNAHERFQRLTLDRLHAAAAVQTG